VTAPLERKTIMRRVILLSVLAASLLVSACNTIAGAGKDVTATGHAVTDTAQDATPH
jgi:entericidin B